MRLIMPRLNTRTLILRSLTTLSIAMLFAQVALAQIPKLNSYVAASATVYLDFDGQTVKGTAWNWDGTIRAQAAGLNNTLISEIFNRVAEDFRIFNLNITTDSTVFKKAPAAKRMRVIFTPTSSWYGNVAGVSFVNSFTWGDDTPAWVFSALLDRNPKYIAEAASHEIGHTLGLQHQSTYDKNCDLVAEYSEGRGSGEIGWAPIMGVGYYRNFSLWTIGQSIEGCDISQNDITVISRGFNNIGLRTDEHGNNRQTATGIIFSGKNFQASGIINNSSDRDFFKINVAKRSRLKASILPASAGKNNSGANVDLFMTLVTSFGDTIGRYNPKTLLSATVDTLLDKGTYYFVADGTANQYVSDYGSVGMYALTGTLDNPPSKPAVLVKGDKRNDENIIRWQVQQGTIPRVTYLEYSIDERNYTSIPVASSSYIHRSPGNNKVSYRVKVILEDETVEYSDVITLDNEVVPNVSLLTNVITTSQIQVKTNGDYNYQLMDETGRLLGKGRLTTGLNSVPVNTFYSGILILKTFNKNEHFHFRLIKQ